MKNKIAQITNKYLSLLLAIVLLASSLIIPMAINAETDDEAKAAAVAALKEAWIDLESEHKGTAFAYPNGILHSGSWITDGILAETAEVDKDYFGNYYGYVESTSNDSSYKVLYGSAEMNANGKYGKEIPYNGTGIPTSILRQKGGFYICLKVEGVNPGTTIKVNPLYNWFKSSTADKTYEITADGTYIIKDTDLYNNGIADIADVLDTYTDNYEKKFQRCGLAFTDLNGAKVTFGSFHWESNEASTVPANIKGMSVNELISAAENVNTALPHYMSSKVNAFRTALNTVKNLYMDDADLFALVNAYKKLENERKGTAFAYPNGILHSGSWITDGILAETAESDKDYFGNHYGYVESTSNAPTYQVLYGSAEMNANGKYGKEIPYNGTGIPTSILRQKGGFYICLKVEGVNPGTTIKVNPLYNWFKSSTADKTYEITADGTYIIKDTDLYNNGIEGIADVLDTETNSYEKKLQRFGLKFTDLNGAKVTFGSLHWESNQQPNIPANIDGMSAEELYSLVSSVDLSDSSYFTANVDAFRTALETFEASHADLLAIRNLKNAWTSMTLDPVTIMSPSQKVNTKVSPAVKSKEDMFVSTNSLSEEEKSKLGAYYATVDTGVYNRIDLTKASNSNWTDVSIADYSDILLNIYVESVTVNDYIKVDIQNSAAATGVQIDINESMVGRWITLSARDIFGKSFAEIKSATSVLKCFLINTNTSGSAVLKIGSLMGVPSVELPEGSENWGVEEWMAQAIKLDTSKYKNTDDFEAALRDFKNLYPEEAFVAEVKSAITSMTLDPITFMSPAQKIDTKQTPAVKSTENMFVSTNSLSEEEKSKLGAYYATVDTGVYNRIDLTKNSTPDWVPVSIANYSDILLNIYVDSVTVDDYIKVTAYTSGATQSGVQIDINKSMEGQWITLSAQEIFGKSFADIKKDINDFKCFLINTNTSGSAVLKIGSLMGIPSVNLPEDSENWDFNKWVLETIKLDTSNYNNTEAFEACRIKALNYKETGNIMSCEMGISPAEGLDLSEFGTNVLNGIKPEITYVNGSEIAEISNKKYVNLTDGDITTSYGIQDATYTGSSYVDIVYQISGRAKITDLLVAAEDLAGIAEYEIYVGNNKANLFSIANREVVYKKTGTDDAQVQIFSYPQKAEAWGTYIGFRFKDPTADDNAEKYIRLLEIGAYGVVQKGSVEASDDYNSASIQKIGNNILAEKKLTPMVKYNGNSINISGLDAGKLYDTDLTTICRFTNGASQAWKKDDGTIYLDVYFDLGSIYKLDKFFISHFNASWDTAKILATGEYAIYASEDFATLFQSTSRIATYNNRSDEKGDGSGTTIAQLFTMYGEGVIARYVSFRIIMPVSDWEAACEKQPGNRVAMISELGVYGEVYNKPVYDANLTPHVPLTVYRSDANGRTEVNEAEFGSEGYELLYDGDTEEAAPVFTNGKTLDYLYNLCGAMDISAFRITTMSPQIKALKIYASLVKDQIWSENSLVYVYYNDSADSAVVEKLFTDTLKKARYVRFSVMGVNDSVFKPVEIEVIGKDNQMATYRNIVQDQEGFVNLYLVDKNTGKYNVFSQNANKVCVETRPIRNLLDADTNSLLDLYAGKNNEQTINILFSIDSISAIDEITLTAGSNSKYWPSKLNYYFGDSEKEVLSSNTPAKSFVGKPEGGVYSYDFLPKQIQYIRVEIAESDNPYFTDKIISVISEISVKGMTIKGIGEGESVASFTDSATGIKVDILKNVDNDVFDRVQSIKVTKRDVSSGEETSVYESLGVNFSSPVYTIELFDSFGKAVTDIGGREILLRFPLSGFEDEDGVYLLQLADGSWKMLDAYAEDGYLTMTLESPLNLCFALSEYKEEEDDPEIEDNPTEDEPEIEDNSTQEEPEADDEFTDDEFTDDEDGYFEELDEELDDPNFEEEQTSGRKKKVIITTQGSWLPYIIGIIAAVLVIGAGGTFIIIFIKKRKRKQ